MSFKNLKITFEFSSNVILNRFTTIDSILLAQHYALLRRSGKMDADLFIKTEDDLENISKWLEVKNGVISGSIWYVAEEKDVYLWNTPVRKSTDPLSIYHYSGKAITSESKPSPQSGEFKRYDLAFETMQVESVYFYIRGDRDYIEKLVSSIKYIGKKSSIGFGWVKNVYITEVGEDKSFQLDAFTAAKPLPVKDFTIESKKVAFHRVLPPYSEKCGKMACYMPTTALVERGDTSRNHSNFKTYIPDGYIGNTAFLRTKLGNELFKIPEKITHYNVFDNSKQNALFEKEAIIATCACCGADVKKGIKGHIKGAFSDNFNDFPSMSKADAICEDCLWSLSAIGESAIGFSLVNNKGATYIQGGKMKVFSENKTENSKLQSRYRRDIVENFDLQQVPFSLNFKTTTNTQHVGFKGELSLSNAFISVNYGDSGAEFVDVELLNEALREMVEIMENTRTGKKSDSGLKKTHLLNMEDYKGNPDMAKELKTLENKKILSNFHKKYNSSIRKVLHKVVF